MATTITTPSVLVVPVNAKTSFTIKSNYKAISYAKVGTDTLFSLKQIKRTSASTSCQITLDIIGIKAGSQKIKITSNDKTTYCEVRVIASTSYQSISGGVMKAPYINQGAGLWNGSKWTYTSWPKSKFAGMNRTLAQSGCGQCCIAMALSYCTGTLIPPVEFQSDSHYRYAHGSDNDCGVYVAPRYNVQASYISKSNWNEVVKQLKAGNPVMAHMYNKTISGIPDSRWTSGRHYILLVGVTSDGRIAVHDPNHTNKTYAIKRITFTRSQIQPALRYDFTVFKKINYTKVAAPVPAPSTPAPAPAKTISNKDKVKAFQKFLNTNYSSILKQAGVGQLLVDGSYGNITRAAALAVWKHMANKYYGTKLTLTNRNFFDSCKAVAAKMTDAQIAKHFTIQQILNGVLAGKGYANVKAYQTAKKISGNGSMNANTWYSLFN